MFPSAKVNGVWPFNDASLRTSFGGGQTPRNVASILDSARELGIRDAQVPHGSNDWLASEAAAAGFGAANYARTFHAAFARPAIYEALEARGVQYAIRIPANKNLELAIEDLLFRSPGRPSLKPLIRYKSFQYQADSWTTPRRVVAKVEHHVGELFPRVGFIVTNLPIHNRAVVRFYNKRGTAEQWI